MNTKKSTALIVLVFICLGVILCPALLWGKVLVSPPPNATHVAIDAPITFTFTDGRDLSSLNFTLSETSIGRRVEGRIEVDQLNQKVIFTPKNRLKYATKYSYELSNVPDEADINAAFETFSPGIISQLPMETASSVDYLENMKTVLVTNGARFRGVDSSGGEVGTYFGDMTGFALVDVTNPKQPMQIGSEITAGGATNIVAIPNSFAGPLAIVVSGNIRRYGNLRIYDMNIPSSTTVLGGRLLSTPPGYNPVPEIPSESGIPMAVAADEDRFAYVANVPIGIQAVDIQKSIGIWEQPRLPQPKIEASFSGTFYDVDFSGGKVLAAGRLSGGGLGLTVLDSELNNPMGVLLDGAIRVKGLKDFKVDIDADHDGEPDSNQIFNLAFIGNGRVGGISVVSLDGCPNANPPASGPCVLGTIPTVVNNNVIPAFDIEIDDKAKLAYVSTHILSKGEKILIIDINRLFDESGNFIPGNDSCGGHSCTDTDRDGTHDPILGIVSSNDGYVNESAIDTERGLLYLANDTEGLSVFQVRPDKVSLDFVTVDNKKFLSSNGITTDEDILIFDRDYNNLCVQISLPTVINTALEYQIDEEPFVDPAGNQGSTILTGNTTGTINGNDPSICLGIDRSTLANNFGSLVKIKIKDQGALIQELYFIMRRSRIDGPELVTIVTQVDRINQVQCPGFARFIFSLNIDARVTLFIDGHELRNAEYDGTPILDENGDAIFKEIPFNAGTHEIIMYSKDVGDPAKHIYKLEATIPDFSKDTFADQGEIFHEVEINASLPIGHTIIKGVDIWDGHLTHSTQDVMIPGRGLSLDFTRTYSSAGFSGDGPLGAGWTHSYNIRLIHDGCSRFVVIGGEGSGNAFETAQEDPQKATLFSAMSPDPKFSLSQSTLFYKPQIGYHSTLVFDPEHPDRGYDFFTKAHIRYHFELEPALSGGGHEVYTLRFIEEPNGNRITLKYLDDEDPTTLDAVIDSSNRALLFEYKYTDIYLKKRIGKIKGSNFTTEESDLMGLELTYYYDEQGNLWNVKRKKPAWSDTQLKDEREEVYTYTKSNILKEQHNMLSYTDPNKNTTYYEYYTPTDNIPGFVASFGIGRHEIIKKVIQPEGVITKFDEYNFTNSTRVVSDPRPDIAPTTYTINDYGATVLIEEPMGKKTYMEWCTDAPHLCCNGKIDVLMVSKTDGEGRRTEYMYDDLGNVIKETIKFSTGENSDFQTVTLGDGVTSVNEVTTEYTYDPTFNKMTSKKDTEGNTTFYQIDSPTYSGTPFCPGGSGKTGNLLGVKDSEGNVTCYSYYPNGDLGVRTDPRRGFGPNTPTMINTAIQKRLLTLRAI